MEASRTAEESSASNESRTWIASVVKANSDWEIRRGIKESKSKLEKKKKNEVPGAGIEIEAMEEDAMNNRWRKGKIEEWINRGRRGRNWGLFPGEDIHNRHTTALAMPCRDGRSSFLLFFLSTINSIKYNRLFLCYFSRLKEKKKKILLKYYFIYILFHFFFKKLNFLNSVF